MLAALTLCDAAKAALIRQRLAEALHCGSLVATRQAITALMSDLSNANRLLPSPEECMADTLRSVPDFSLDVTWEDDDQAPSTDSSTALGLEFGGP